ncbi:MAG: plasmid maintenance protein CcdB [Rhodospirillaceae bacterium]|nr:MAG: plasmid maintenance protein CcdB [Rhodospirillaceae bacterium]
MARYDVYANPNGSGYLLDVQADLLDTLNTRVVVPLLLENEAPNPADRLNPIFKIEGKQVVMVSQFLAAVPVSILQNPVTNISENITITNALDMVFQGF